MSKFRWCRFIFSTAFAGAGTTAYAQRDVEVLLLADPVDAFWVSSAAGYDGKPFKSVSQGVADIKTIPLKEGAPPPGETSAEVATLIATSDPEEALEVADRILFLDDRGLRPFSEPAADVGLASTGVSR